MKAQIVEVDVIPTPITNPALYRHITPHARVHITPFMSIYVGGPDVTAATGYMIEGGKEWIYHHPEEPLYAISLHGVVSTSILEIGLL